MVLNDMGETKGGVRSEDGGLRYEVVLEEAKTKKMPRPKSAPAPRKYENVEEKLKVNEYNKSFSEKDVKLDIDQALCTGGGGEETGAGEEPAGGSGRQGQEGRPGQGQEGHHEGCHNYRKYSN